MSGRNNQTRDDDALMLAMLSARCAGETSTVIAARYSLSPEQVRTATNRVMVDDLRDSGEPRKSVLAHYWRPTP
jgi:hypothetical protein